jgi:flavin-dependent dehydrogenase
MAAIVYDLAIVGGGPAGSTVGALVKKYHPDATVVILERERFPRDHVGESQLPPITQVLDEMGCWDKVEAAGFPVKTGALYRWGDTNDLWRFDFLINQEYEDKPRPGSLEGQRLQTTFHVERSIFDKILLDHAQELGCEVCEETKVTEVRRDGDRIAGIKTEGNHPPAGADPEGWVTAKHYIDATGHVGLLRRNLGVEIEEPTLLKNIAVWQYWRKPEWADMDGVGKGGIRVRVLSLGNGWIWFIPLSKDRASVGFVTHADHYKKSGLKPAELYAQALKDEPNAAALLEGAEPEGEVSSTKDWSFLASRMAGENWMLVGESAGFADPILAGGMTLAMVGARDAAYIHAALLKGEHDEKWLKDWYSDSQSRKISQHIKFADYWYSANGHFSELKEYTSQIADQAGLTLDPESAFRWLGTGGFVSDDLAFPVVGTYRLGAVKSVMQILSGVSSEWEINRFNRFTLDLAGSESVHLPFCQDGKIERVKCYRRGVRLLPMVGMYRIIYRALTKESDASGVVRQLKALISATPEITEPYNALLGALEALEGLVAEGWVKAEVTEGRPFINVMLDESTVSLAAS